MRKLAATAALVVLSFVTPTASLGQEVEPDTLPGLEASYPMQVGDYAAVLLPEFLKIRRDLTNPVLVTYEPEPNRLDVEVFGTAVTVEQARLIIGAHWDFIETFFLPYAQRRLGLTLDKSDFAIAYYDTSRQDWAKPVLQMIDGQFVMQ